MNAMEKLLAFLRRLESHHIYYRLDHPRDEAIMVTIDVPWQKWEVEFLADGEVEIEVFKSDGEIRNETELDRFFKEFAE